MDKSTVIPTVLILGGAGVALYLFSRPVPKATGPIDAALDVLSGIGGAAKGLAEGVLEIVPTKTIGSIQRGIGKGIDVVDDTGSAIVNSAINSPGLFADAIKGAPKATAHALTDAGGSIVSAGKGIASTVTLGWL